MTKKIILFLLITVSIFIPLLSYASDLADDLENTSFETLKSYRAEELGAYYMRGFACSKDGKSLYGGMVHGEKRGIYRFNAKEGYYDGLVYNDPENGLIKGIATDDRGYIYAGITKGDSPLDAVSFACLNEDLEELSYYTYNLEGKVGINGVTIHKTGKKYLLYLITNYGPNYILCFDVTDPEDPRIYKEFGDNGKVDIKALLQSAAAEANYMEIDKDGTVYLTANTNMSGKKGDSVYKISPDFSKILEYTELNEAYGICLKGNYVYVSTYAGANSSVNVFEKQDMSFITEIGNIPGAANYTGVVITGGKIYISDQEYDGGARIIVSESIKGFKRQIWNKKYTVILILFAVFGLVVLIVSFSIKKLNKAAYA